MYFSGFADEAGADIDTQIKATKQLRWRNIEARGVDGVNIHDLPPDQFDRVAQKLSDARVHINCFGSTVANWSQDPIRDEDFQAAKAALLRAVPRMHTLGTLSIRGMSFTRYRDPTRYTAEVEHQLFEKVRTLVSICADNGIVYLHENCANYGGMSSDHTLRLIEEVDSPAFQLVFDTGNPVNSIDYRPGHTNHMQDALQFYRAVREHVTHVHIKDGRFIGLQPEEIFNQSEWTFPGEGDGKVREILTDLIQRGYQGGLSIEPHMATVYHRQDDRAQAQTMYDTYIEYGKRLMRLVEEITTETTGFTP